MGASQMLLLSPFRVFETPWIIVCQAPLALLESTLGMAMQDPGLISES